MITLKNGHSFEYMAASGALGFGWKGWLWDYPFRWSRLLDPSLFTIVIKSLTRKPRPGHRRWYDIFGIGCVRFIKDGTLNAVGLTNPGIDWWSQTIGPDVDRTEYALVGSIFGTRPELTEMARTLDDFDLVGLEVNASCPNTGHSMKDVQLVVDDVRAVWEVSRHPIIIKVSVAQNYREIVWQLKDVAQAVSLNSVPSKLVFGDTPSPLRYLDLGGGGVSGKRAQPWNWRAVEEIADEGHMPVIGPSVWEYGDIAKLRNRGAQAISFGAIHMPRPFSPRTWFNPAKPTRWVRRELCEKEQCRAEWSQTAPY